MLEENDIPRYQYFTMEPPVDAVPILTFWSRGTCLSRFGTELLV
jgi:hypothetical protein